MSRLDGSAPNRTTTAELYCDNCGGDRRHAIVGWNGVGKPIYSCQSEDCEERRVGPMRSQDQPRVAADGGQR